MVSFLARDAPPFVRHTALLLYVGHATVEPGSLPPCPVAALGLLCPSRPCAELALLYRSLLKFVLVYFGVSLF